MKKIENKKIKKQKKKELELVAIEGASKDTVERHGKAMAVHLKAYDSGSKNKHIGIKNITGTKENCAIKVGRVAEEYYEANKNEELILKKKKPIYSRTDKIEGRINDEYADIDIINNHTRNTITKYSVQLKVVGGDKNGNIGDYKKAFNALNKKEFDKYYVVNEKIAIPDDFCLELKKNGGYIDKEIENLKKQIKNTKNNNEIKKIQDKIDKYKKIKKSIVPIGKKYKELIFITKHPKLSNIENEIRLANKAGVEQIKYGAMISGSISMVKNVVSCVKGEQTPKESGIAFAKDVGVGAIVSYSTAFSGTVLQSLFENSSNVYVRDGLANTNIASGIISTSVNVGKIITKCIKGEINFEECIEELGEKGIGEIGSAMYASIGTFVLPTGAPAVSVIAMSMTGATVGYAMASAVYHDLLISVKEYNFAKQERKKIEKECEEVLVLLKQYRNEMNEIVDKYMKEYTDVFNKNYNKIDKALNNDDLEEFINGNVAIQEFLGKNVQFRNDEELEKFMNEEDELIL